MNVRQQTDLLRQNMQPIPSHFPPQSRQQPATTMGLISNANNPMALLTGAAQSNPNPQLSAQRFQGAVPQNSHQPANPSVPPAHMPLAQGHPLFSNMMQSGTRPRSHPYPQGMIPPQQGVNGMNMGMNQHLRQATMPDPMSSDAMGRQPNPQNQLRPGGQQQLMHSLPSPSGLPQFSTQNSFQQSVPHPHQTSSSPRPGIHPPQHVPVNMMMGAPGSSQPSGPRPMGHVDNSFVGLPNPQLPPNMVAGPARIANPNSTFPFGPSVTQGDNLGMPQSVGEGLGHSTNPPMRPGFQPTPTQKFDQLPQNDNFAPHFNHQSQGNVPPRPPSHPNSMHGNSIPARPMQPQHSPHQSDPMAGHVQQQPQRPQSQPHGPPGRPPSQAGPSHTPRATQSQLPPSALHPSVRIASQTQAQPSQLHQRQSPSVQPTIAPRPMPGPSANPLVGNAVNSEANVSQQQAAVIQRPAISSIRVAPPLGLGQGCLRILSFSGQLANESPQKHQLSFWDALVKEYFAPKAVMKITLWKDNQRVEAKPLEIGVPILPRFFLVTTQSGVKSMSLSLDGARERFCTHTQSLVECISAVWTYKYTNGYTVTLRGPLTVHVILYPLPNPTSSQQAPFSLKFEHFQFDANFHEKFIALDYIQAGPTIDSPKTPRTRNNPTPSPNGAPSGQRTDDERQWDEPRQLIANASIPGEPVNAFGIPQVTMRCLELAEGVSQMADLIAFASETHLGPMDALAELAKKIREGRYPTPMNGIAAPWNMNGLGSLQGFGTPMQVSPAVTLHHGMSTMTALPHAGPSSSSPQSAQPSADTPQKQSGSNPTQTQVQRYQQQLSDNRPR